MPKSPCLNCPDSGCGPKHSTCSKYIEFQEQIELIRYNKRKFQETENNFIGLIAERERKRKNHRRI